MLISAHPVSVDAKGRVSIPARFREHLSATYGDQVILIGKDGCIFVYPVQEWKRKFSEKLEELSTSSKEVRRTLRRLYGRAESCEFDRQGRILLPAKLRSNSSIEKDAVIAGIENRLEIWDKAKWNEEMGDVEDGESGTADEESAEDLIEFEF
ncbi:MAG: division/cell wall cluster transcriptional repressor MraZ [Nitrospinae bacterium]|nr:division/cell wall cluster transcriptional repressor MraZ [Nitrospinota bacterium]